MNQQSAIDFVVTWVDDTDPAWREKKAKHTGCAESEGNTAVRYRDWDTLKYWFRGVEKFAPWVRNIYFITDNQKPEWLNPNHPKLKLVNHTDFIPEEYLPTFSSNTIEWNIHRIKGLSDKFVYFNDDVFLIKSTKPEDFFVNGLPCDLPNIGPLYPNSSFNYLVFNNIFMLNKHFTLKKSIMAHPIKWIKHQSLEKLIQLVIYGKTGPIPGSTSHHIQVSYQKKTFDILWEKEYDSIHSTCKNKLRTKEDLTSWCVRDWQLFSGEFHPKKPIGKLFHTATMAHNNNAIEYLKKRKGKVICLNDTEDETDFELHKQMILDEFEKILPDKSSFEL